MEFRPDDQSSNLISRCILNPSSCLFSSPSWVCEIRRPLSPLSSITVSIFVPTNLINTMGRVVNLKFPANGKLEIWWKFCAGANFSSTRVKYNSDQLWKKHSNLEPTNRVSADQTLDATWSNGKFNFRDSELRVINFWSCERVSVSLRVLHPRHGVTARRPRALIVDRAKTRP